MSSDNKKHFVFFHIFINYIENNVLFMLSNNIFLNYFLFLTLIYSNVDTNVSSHLI